MIFTGALSITTIHHTVNLIATLFACFSIVGLLFVILFLFQGERGAATAQSSRREQQSPPRMSEPPTVPLDAERHLKPHLIL
jgi:hypothetical protein